MVPDFVARSSHSATEVLIEIVGFWKREYLEKKMEKIRLLGSRRLVLIVNSNLSVSREELLVLGDDRVRVFFYSNRTELKRVAETVAEELQRIGEEEETVHYC
jgi:predicted nuclease of restriction endonuclease-like RecB superfamily